MDYVQRIVTNARVKLTGAADDAIKFEFFNVVDEFLRETDIWQESIDFVTVIPEFDTVYDLVPTLGTIIRLIGLRWTDQRIPFGGVMRVPGELILTSPIDAGQNLTATVSLAPLDPTVTVTDFPDIDLWIYDRYFQAFIDGLISKMAAQSDKPYSDPNLVKYHGSRFRNAIGIAKADNFSTNVAGGQSWRFPDFAAQRNTSRQVR